MIPGKTAVTIYPYIFWSKKRLGWKNSCIIKHEMYHWNEQRKWIENKKFGLVRWLIKYITQWFWFNVIKRLPPTEHPMEKPAYEAETSYSHKITYKDSTNP